MTADELAKALLEIAAGETVCLLDSCGVGHLGSHLLIAGIDPVETFELNDQNCERTLAVLDDKVCGDLAAVFTISYDFGLKLLGITQEKSNATGDPSSEPDIFVARFDSLIVHDYETGSTYLVGDRTKFDGVQAKLAGALRAAECPALASGSAITSNFTRDGYLDAVGTIQERIRRGDTYQTNLTQQLTARLPAGLTPQTVFSNLRRDHPAPFAAYIGRDKSVVVSASPERFFRLDMRDGAITTSPIKGTRPRGDTPSEDDRLRRELLASKKDRAENTMIVDLLRNDLGRVCDYGSITVEKLCDLEEHPTLFHLVSTVRGQLRENLRLSGILKAVFPCGSITGAPKISTMRIIDEIEPSDRGLSMGSIGYYVPGAGFGDLGPVCDLSVAIRTMVIRDNIATFNVGGGIVIDSEPESEYAETLLKARALVAAIGASMPRKDF